MAHLRRQPKGRQMTPVVLGLALVAAALWAQHTDLGPVRDLRHRLEGVAYDLRFDLTRPFAEGEDAGVVIVDIDERSLREEGRWPWPRAKVADLVERLFAAGAVVVGMDTVFAEPERNLARRTRERLRAVPDLEPPETVWDILDRAAPKLDGDRTLARALTGTDTVLGFMLSSDAPNKGALGPPLTAAGLGDPATTGIRNIPGHLGNLAPLQEAAASAGFFSILPDGDGILRRYHLVLGHEGEVYPSLALAMARLYLLAEEVEIHTAPVGDVRPVDHLELANMRLPTDGEGAVLVPYRGEQHSFPYIAATDVLSGAIGSDRLAGKLVLVGSSAQGLFDLRATPVANVFPGVEVHANVLRGILTQRFPKRPNWAEGANFAFMMVGGLLLAGLLPRLRPLMLTMVSLGVAVVLAVTNIALWDRLQWDVPLALPLIMVLVLGSLNMAYGFLFEERRRLQLKDLFSQYVPPELVEEIAADPDSAASLGGERREMTVLFADIRGFTTISEALSASELKDLLNRFFTPMTRIIFENRGTIDKYVGDMIMAFWGAPLTDPDHAGNAVAAALAMQAEAERLGETLAAEGYPEIAIGVGLNTGPMNVGNMGSDYRRSYTVLGDAVNLGSRLEGLTKTYGVGVVVGETTRAGLEDAFLFRRLDRVRVKGRAEPLTIYQPLCATEAADAGIREEVAAHERALDAYFHRDWATAREVFGELADSHPDDPLYRLFLERMAETDPTDLAADWDGVYRHESK
ncbi:CHASE2 domain-containing protein [Thiohalorhabdus sp.]|uniref:CHASE2 domain-containing protein n=1 Tax=Thiohalorhabdus sp. TaxID=3094134 RepID=UPI002FC3C625